MSVEEALLELLRPVIARSVRDEMKRTQAELRWLSASEAARRLGCSAEAVRKRVRRGTLPGRVHGRRVYVDLAELNRELSQR